MKFKVWVDGEEYEEHAREFTTFDAEGAAEEWAKWYTSNGNLEDGEVPNLLVKAVPVDGNPNGVVVKVAVTVDYEPVFYGQVVE